jgi:TonB family protein
MRRVWAVVSVLVGLPVLTLVLAAPAGSARRAATDARGVDALLEGLGRRISEAQFQDVLEQADAARESLADTPDSPARRLQLARLETLAASAHLALSDPEGAERCFARALELVPALELDPVRHSPKVRRAFALARRSETSEDAVEVSRLFRPGDAVPQQLRARAVRSPDTRTALSPTVTLRLLVDVRGAVAEAHVYQPRAELVAFEQAALRAAQDFRFEPARRAGQPVPAWVQYPVRFE